MADFLRRHPLSSIAGVFFGTILIVVGFSYFIGTLLVSSSKCPAYPNDPCDAAPMLAISIWMLSVPASMLLGAVASLVIYFLYIKD